MSAGGSQSYLVIISQRGVQIDECWREQLVRQRDQCWSLKCCCMVYERSSQEAQSKHHTLKCCCMVYGRSSQEAQSKHHTLKCCCMVYGRSSQEAQLKHHTLKCCCMVYGRSSQEAQSKHHTQTCQPGCKSSSSANRSRRDACSSGSREMGPHMYTTGLPSP